MAAPSQADPAATSAAAGNDGQKKVPLVTKEQVDSAYDNKDTEYEVVRELAPEIQLVRRRDDGAEFLGFPWDIEQTAPKLHALINRGAGQAVEALLCHPNLVGYCTAAPFHLLRGARRVRRLLSLWDYCGAGTLETLLTKSQLPVRSCPRTGNIQGWLPESICWHVALSLLSALAWLHEGHYEEEVAEWQGETGWGTPTKVTKTYTAEFREGEDWMPILHRYIVPGNIYFQDPKGIETYGMCKLGNYSRVFVSGHVNQWSGGHVVCSQDGRAPLAHVMQNMALDNIYSIEKEARPYMKGTELYKVGAILYQMMTRQTLPHKEECSMDGCEVRHWMESNGTPCPIMPDHGVFKLEDKTQPLTPYYTPRLVALLEHLAGYWREDADAREVLAMAKGWFEEWRTDTDAGEEYRDVWDDMVLREQNAYVKRQRDKARAWAQSGPKAADFVDAAVTARKNVEERARSRENVQEEDDLEARLHALRGST